MHLLTPYSVISSDNCVVENLIKNINIEYNSKVSDQKDWQKSCFDLFKIEKNLDFRTNMPSHTYDNYGEYRLALKIYFKFYVFRRVMSIYIILI